MKPYLYYWIILIACIFTVSPSQSKGNADKWYRSAELKFDHNDYQGAISDYTKVIIIDPKDFTAYVKRGLAKNALKDYRGAIDDFSLAIDLRPDKCMGPIYGSRAEAKRQLNDYQGAIADFTRMIDCEPNYGPAYHLRGIAKMELKDYQGAIADFTKGINLSPGDLTEAYFLRGNAKFELKDYQGAIADLSHAITENPNLPEPHYNRGMSWFMVGQKELAFQDFMKAIELGGRVPQSVLDACK